MLSTWLDWSGRAVRPQGSPEDPVPRKRDVVAGFVSLGLFPRMAADSWPVFL